MSEVGNAQVPVFPVFEGFRSKVNTEVSGAAKTAGKTFTTAFKGAADMQVDTSRLTRAVGQAGGVLAKARQKQALDAGRVRVAEAQLAEAIQKTGTSSSRTIAAEEKLSAAQRNLETSSERTEAAVKDLATAQDRLKKASNNAATAGKNAASKYAAGWSGVKQRIQGTLSSAFKGGSAKASGAAASAGSGLGITLGGSMKAGIIGMLGSLAFGSVLDGFNEVVTGASDLNETVNKSQTIFAGQFKSVDKWAQSAATSLGLSRREALDAASGFGDMFRQLGFTGKAASKMAQDVVQMSADLGSFNNLPTAEVSDMVAAAFRGEYDSLQRLIPNINAARVEKEALAASGKKNAKQLTAEEKAAAVLAIVHKDGARAMGDFAKTSAQLANRQKIQAAQAEDLSNRFGAMLIPIKQLALDGFAGLLKAGEQVTAWLEKNPAVMEGFTAGLSLMGDVASGLAQVLGPVLGFAAVSLIRTFSGLTRTAGDTLAALGTIPGFQWAADAAVKLHKVADGADAIAQGITDLGKAKATPEINVENEKAKAEIRNVDKQLKSLHDKVVTAKAKGDTKEVDKLRERIAKLKDKKVKLSAEVKKTGISTISVAPKGGKGWKFSAYRAGGIIGGFGTGTSDSNLIAASRGEYMFRQRAVQKIGQKALDYMNETGNLPAVPVGGGGNSAPVVIQGNVYGDSYLAQINRRDATRRKHQMQREGM